MVVKKDKQMIKGVLQASGEHLYMFRKLTTGRTEVTSALFLVPNLQSRRMTHSEVSMVLALFGFFPPPLSSRALCVHLILDHGLLFESTYQVSARKRNLFCDFKM